jgi:hypothetical protein
MDSRYIVLFLTFKCLTLAGAINIHKLALKTLHAFKILPTHNHQLHEPHKPLLEIKHFGKVRPQTPIRNIDKLRLPKLRNRLS